jgi:phage baseplate assembly protein W
VASISRSFKDVSLSFKRHPVTNDILVIKNEDTIKRSVQNIVLTIVGEKPFEPDFGTNINDSLFELNTTVQAVGLEEQIRSALLLFEPRIANINVTVSIEVDTNAMFATVQYDIVGLPVPTQTVDVLLLPARV